MRHAVELVRAWCSERVFPHFARRDEARIERVVDGRHRMRHRIVVGPLHFGACNDLDTTMRERRVAHAGAQCAGVRACDGRLADGARAEVATQRQGHRELEPVTNIGRTTRVALHRGDERVRGLQ